MSPVVDEGFSFLLPPFVFTQDLLPSTKDLKLPFDGTQQGRVNHGEKGEDEDLRVSKKLFKRRPLCRTEPFSMSVVVEEYLIGFVSS